MYEQASTDHPRQHLYLYHYYCIIAIHIIITAIIEDIIIRIIV